MPRVRRGTMEGFAKRLDDLILASGYTYKQVADKIGKERKSIYGYKSGDTIPDGVTICRLCYVLHTTPNYLLLGNEKPMDEDMIKACEEDEKCGTNLPGQMNIADFPEVMP